MSNKTPTRETKAMRQAVKNHCKTFGRDFALDVDVYVTNQCGYLKPERKVEINYGTKGFLAIGEAKRFHRSLGAAIRYAEKYQHKLDLL